MYIGTKTISEYRAKAREMLGFKWTKGLWAKFALISLYYLLISYVLGAIDGSLGFYGQFIFLADIFTMGAFGYAISHISLCVVRSHDFVDKDLFIGFSNYSKTFLLNLLITIFVFLWSLLLIVPGIIKAISYSMSFYILSDDKFITANEARKKSTEMMYGHKGEYFCLMLSFIGWFLLGILTLGILFIWVIPYIETTTALFYEDLKKAYEKDKDAD